MRISVFGLGYVGAVSAACFAESGHEVIGCDVNELKVQIINEGRSPVVEPGVEELIASGVKEGRLRATTEAVEAVMDSDVSLICVGTPGNANGSLDLNHIKNVCKHIGSALETKHRYHVIVVRSTMLPGTVHDVVIPTLEVYSGKKAGRDFGVAINPEFLREGTSIYDFYHPPFTLVGADDEEAAFLVRKLYSHINAPVLSVKVKEAEMVKYACNSFHALKVVFANEIGNVCKTLGVDSHKVMDVFCQDTKLNLSPYYLKPGFAFGGSCLPKDVRALTYKARTLDLETPLLNSLLVSNRLQIERAAELVAKTGKKQIGILGLSFKAGTDDLRESPTVTLIELLLGKGYKVSIYDKEVELARIFGANREYIEREIPHISSLMREDIHHVIEGAEVIVIGKKSEEYRAIYDYLNNGRTVIDLVRLIESNERPKSYQGICW
jgi:GDP-mannose 6-dehydrogenase